MNINRGNASGRFFNTPAEKLRLFDQNCQGWQWFHIVAMFWYNKTRLQLMYMDVQQLKMVQMVSQSQFFRDFYLFCLMRFPLCWKNVRNFKQNFAQKEGNRCKYFIMRLPCKYQF